MKTSIYRIPLVVGAFAVCLMAGSAFAQTATDIGTGDPFTLVFDENGNGSIDNRDGTGFHLDAGFASLDPNTGVMALTYLLTGNIGPGIVDILDPSSALSDAISFYNIGANGYMAFYSTAGTDLADTISGGFVPVSGFSIGENANGTFAFYAGGAPGVNNDYLGTSTPSGVPDSGSTVAMLSGAFTLLAAARRKLRK